MKIDFLAWYLAVSTTSSVGAWITTSTSVVTTQQRASWQSVQSTSRCQSTMVADDTVTVTDTPKAKQPTRFDRLKKNYKGPRFVLDDEIAAADLSFSYADLQVAVDNTVYGFQRNAVVQGVVVEYTGTGCLVDIGAKSSAYLPEQEAALSLEYNEDGSAASHVQLEDFIPLNTPMDFQVISEEDENGQLLVSLKRLQFKQAWEKVLEMAASDQVFMAPVVGINRGGAICLVQGLRAFLPGSHLSGQLADDDLVGQTLPLKFLEVTQETNKLVVSNRKAVVETQMADLSRGDLVTGVVKALKPYGAFVEVGGMSGLLHISQISYDRIEDLEQVLQPGMQVKCMIIDHDKVNGRIALSTKTLEPEPGDMLKNPAMVFERAEQTAAAYHERMESQRLATEQNARSIVMGLGGDDLLDDFGDLSSSLNSGSSSKDPLQDVSDSLDALLA